MVDGERFRSPKNKPCTLQQHTLLLSAQPLASSACLPAPAPLLKPILQRLHFHTLPCREVSTLLRGLTNSEAAARTYEAPLTISSPIWNVIVKGWFLVSNKKKKIDDKDYRRRDVEAFAMCSKVSSIAPQHITQRIPLYPSHSPVQHGLLPASLQRRESQGLGKPRSQRLRKRKLKFEPQAVWHQSSGP